MVLGKQLKNLRNQNGLKQSDVAAYLGITTTQYQRYEVGKSNPRTEDLPRLAEYFGVSINDLFDSSELVPEISSSVPSEVQKLFDKLDETEQAAVIQMMKTLIKGKKE